MDEKTSRGQSGGVKVGGGVGLVHGDIVGRDKIVLMTGYPLSEMYSDFESSVFGIWRIARRLTDLCEKGTQNDPEGLRLQEELSVLGWKMYENITRLHENLKDDSALSDQTMAFYGEIRKLFDQQGPVSADLIMERLGLLRNSLRARSKIG